MRLATVAFYGFGLGLLAVGLREMLTGFEENRCSMTYMFEYPEYRVSSLANYFTNVSYTTRELACSIVSASLFPGRSYRMSLNYSNAGKQILVKPERERSLSMDFHTPLNVKSEAVVPPNRASVFSQWLLKTHLSGCRCPCLLRMLNKTIPN